jgi:hydroxymethylglutaryl-CoA lyase
MRERIYLREVGLRDGLQLVRDALPTAQKLQWIQEEFAAGVNLIEVTSFVPPSAFPIFADSIEVASAAKQIRGLIPSALVPNLKGAVLAFNAELPQVNYVISASEAHSRANVWRTTAEALKEFERIVELRRERHLDGKVALSCGIATAFGCTIQGEVNEDAMIDLLMRLADCGADEIMIADTVGYANPAQVERVFSRALEALPNVSIAGHFHDTRGLGLANMAAAARVGVRRFDASLGGLGGCPYAPGATGNVNFEDAAFMLESMGFETGLDFEKLLAVRRKLPSWLPSERLTGAVERSGVPKTFYSAFSTMRSSINCC